MTSSSANTEVAQFFKIIAQAMILFAVAFVIMAREGVGPNYFDAIGKSLFWSAVVLFPLLALSQDVLRLTSGKFAALGLVALQCIFVFYAFGKIQDLNFIILTPLCFIQALVFALPLMLIRKIHKGIWY